MQNRFRKFNSDLFETRLLLQKVVCLHGPEAAALFYDTDRFKRTGAIPKRVQKSLLGENGVQTMDDAAHRHRKQMFMSVMSQDSINRLLELMAVQWQSYIDRWETKGRVVIYEEVREIMCRGAWAGIR